MLLMGLSLEALAPRSDLERGAVSLTSRHLPILQSQDSRIWRTTAYYLDFVRYASFGHQDEYGAEIDTENDVQIKDLVKEVFSGTLSMQNHRKGQGPRVCSGRCVHCYIDESVDSRGENRSPMSVGESVSVIKEALALGFHHFEFFGCDTLDDADTDNSLLAIVEGCKSNEASFRVITNAFYLIRNSDQAKGFFEELAKALGGKEGNTLEMVFSWDPQKIEVLKKDPVFEKFKNREQAVVHAMAKVVHAYREVFSELDPTGEDLIINIIVSDVSSTRLIKRERDLFTRKINDALRSLYPEEDVEIDPAIGALAFASPRHVKSAILKARVTRQFSVERLLGQMIDQDNLCTYTPLLNMAQSELSCCYSKQYPYRKVNPENFKKVLFAPYHSPRTRNLFLGSSKERAKALKKQLAFALALDPSLINEEQVSLEEVESHLFLDGPLMAKINLMFLLDNLVDMLEQQGTEIEHVALIPKELLGGLLSHEIIQAYYAYCARYREVVYGPLETTEIHKECSKLAGRGRETDGYLQNEIKAFLIQNRLISGKALPGVPGDFPFTYQEAPHLPSLDDAGFDGYEWLKKSIGSHTPKEQKKMVNILWAYLNGTLEYDPSVAKLMVNSLNHQNLDAEERFMVLELFDGLLEDWGERFQPLFAGTVLKVAFNLFSVSRSDDLRLLAAKVIYHIRPFLSDTPAFETAYEKIAQWSVRRYIPVSSWMRDISA